MLVDTPNNGVRHSAESEKSQQPIRQAQYFSTEENSVGGSALLQDSCEPSGVLILISLICSGVQWIVLIGRGGFPW